MTSSNGRRFTVAFLVAGSLALVSGCGQKNPYQDALSISVIPSQFALIGPGPVANCVDRDQFKIAEASASGGGIPVLSYSAQGPVITYNSFRFEWKSTDTLYVEEIRVNVSGSGIATPPYNYTFTPQEVEALLATDGAIINPPTQDTVSPVAPSPDTIIVSSDAQTRSGSAYALYAPCSFIIGGVPLTSLTKTPPFQANVTITVIGMAQDSGGTQRFVTVTLSSTAKYYGS